MANMIEKVIEELTALPRTDLPFLTITVDWRTDSNGKRPSVMMVEQELTRIGGELPERGPERESFDADRERIMDYMNTAASDEVDSLIIFACNGEGVWRTLGFKMALQTEVVVDHYAHIFNLARIADDFEPYALVLADGQESQIYVVMYNAPSLKGETEAPEKIKRFEAGGQAQMLFQRRTENLVKAHSKDIAEELGRLMSRYNIERVVIGSNDSVKGTIRSQLPDQIKDKLLEYINVDLHADVNTIIQQVDPIIRAAEDEQEAKIVADLEDRIATKGGLGFVGIPDIAMALTKGQVDTLIIHQNFNGVGGECPNCGTIRAGQRAKCPFDGTELQPLDLKEAFVSRTFQQSGKVQIVAASEFLEQHDGVGALLRYRDDEEGVAAHQVGDNIA